LFLEAAGFVTFAALELTVAAAAGEDQGVAIRRCGAAWVADEYGVPMVAHMLRTA
jgi:hypothetical protein